MQRLLLFVITSSMKVLLVQAVDTINYTSLGIVGGVDCTEKETRYLVSIQTLKQYHWCGGSLLSQRWVLTAAHCCPKKLKGQLIVYSGLSSLKSSSLQSSQVDEFYTHPEFVGEPFKNDVCLLKLRTPILETDNVYYVHLASPANWALYRKDDCESGLVLGFGYRGDVHVNGTVVTPMKNFDTKVQCANLSIIDESDCSARVVFDKSMFCAMDLVKGKPGPCSGDSGGPFICNGVQYGVISAVVGCGTGSHPALFSRVDIHLEFFKAIIANKCERTASYLYFCCLIFILRLIVLNTI